VLVQPLSAVTTADQADTIVSPSTQDQFVDETAELKIAGAFFAPAKPAMKGEYRLTDFTIESHRINSDAFYSQEYDVVLSDLIAHVLAQEAPILDSLLVQRIARAHGFQRSGRLIRERVLDLTEKN
ncbi:DUF3320 domain-containing protein, partial [Burkholderia sp. SIMBA_045]